MIWYSYLTWVTIARGYYKWHPEKKRGQKTKKTMGNNGNKQQPVNKYGRGHKNFT